MKAVELVVSSIALALFVLNPVFATPPPLQGPPEPPRKCVIQEKAWCIQEGAAVEITLAQREGRDEVNNNVWRLRDVRHPAFVMTIVEPEGCRRSYADSVQALGYSANVAWRGQVWDEMRVSLRTDGGCTLRILVTPYNGSDFEWAYSTGRLLLAACKDEGCDVLVPTIADVTSVYRDRFRGTAKGD